MAEKAEGVEENLKILAWEFSEIVILETNIYSFQAEVKF